MKSGGEKNERIGMITINEARTVLGGVGSNMTDQEILDAITLFQNMCESWLDSFEIKTFGMTIKRLLTTKEGVGVR